MIGTVPAQLILFRMLRSYGAGWVSLVTYLMPVFALAYGRLLLDEELTALTLSGLVLTLAGVALAGLAPPGRTDAEGAVTNPG